MLLTLQMPLMPFTLVPWMAEHVNVALKDVRTVISIFPTASNLQVNKEMKNKKGKREQRVYIHNISIQTILTLLSEIRFFTVSITTLLMGIPNNTHK